MLGALAAAASEPPPAAEPRPCRTVNFTNNLLPTFSGHERDIPATISCVHAVDASTPPFILTFSERKRGKESDFWTVHVSPVDEPSRRQALPNAVDPPVGGCGLVVGDFNFDGFSDLALPRDFTQGYLGGITRCWRTYLLYDRATATFVAQETLSGLSGISFDGATNEVKSHRNDGRAGGLYTKEIYRFHGSDLVLQRRDQRRWDDAARCLRATVEERRDGAMHIVRDELVGEGTADFYDGDTWDLVDAPRLDLGANLADARAVVLRSHPAPGRDEAEQAFHLDLVLAQGRDVLYRLSRAPLNPPPGVAPNAGVEHGFLDADVELKDVTNDGRPEVLFVSGEYSGLNEVVLRHVIHCDDATRRCRDVRDAGFITCRRDDFQWLPREGRIIAVRATPVPDDTCDFRYCAAPFEFVAWEWDAENDRFVVTRSLKTTERLTKDGIDANPAWVDRLLR